MREDRERQTDRDREEDRQTDRPTEKEIYKREHTLEKAFTNILEGVDLEGTCLPELHNHLLPCLFGRVIAPPLLLRHHIDRIRNKATIFTTTSVTEAVIHCLCHRGKTE